MQHKVLWHYCELVTLKLTLFKTSTGWCTRIIKWDNPHWQTPTCTYSHVHRSLSYFSIVLLIFLMAMRSVTAFSFSTRSWLIFSAWVATSDSSCCTLQPNQMYNKSIKDMTKFRNSLSNTHSSDASSCSGHKIAPQALTNYQCHTFSLIAPNPGPNQFSMSYNVRWRHFPRATLRSWEHQATSL